MFRINKKKFRINKRKFRIPKKKFLENENESMIVLKVFWSHKYYSRLEHSSNNEKLLKTKSISFLAILGIRLELNFFGTIFKALKNGFGPPQFPSISILLCAFQILQN